MDNTMKNTNASAFCRLFSLGLLILVLTACGETDPRKESLARAVRLIYEIVTSRELLQAVRNADPQMRASTAAGAALSGGITANFRLPPEDIAILTTPEPTQTWSVTIKGDDENKQVIIEGYGEDLKKPLITEEIDFPPK